MSATDANGVDYSAPSSSSFTLPAQQPVGHFGNSRPVDDDDQSATSSTLEVSEKIKNKKRQPKYRATKRPPSERRFQCDHCESRFFTQKDVKRHLVVHTGVRNFACPYCTQRFGRKDHLVRHAKKSHDKDTRSLKRRNGSGPGSPEDVTARTAGSTSTITTESKRSNRKSSGSSRSRRRADHLHLPEDPFGPPPSTGPAAPVTTTSPSTSYYLQDNSGFSNVSRVPAATSSSSSSSVNYSNSALMLSSTSTSLHPFSPKMTLVDTHSPTSTLTASFTHPRNYPSSCFNNYESTAAAAASNFNYQINGAAAAAAAFNQFLPPLPDSQSAAQYALQLPPPHPPPNTGYLNTAYDYKPPPPLNNGGSYAAAAAGSSSSHHEGFLASPNSAGNLSFKTLTSSIADTFSNACIEVEYSGHGMAASAFSAPSISSSSGVPFTESGHQQVSRFHSPFN